MIIRRWARRAWVPAALGAAATAMLLSTAVTAAPPDPSATAASGKLRNGLAALVADPSRLDERIPELMRGYQTDELAVFARLSRIPDDAIRNRVRERGARILRSYRTAPILAIAATPDEVRAVAGLDAVRWLVPVEVIVPLDHREEVDQSSPPTGTPVDLDVPALWDLGMTGEGVTIAILDTGMDLTHPDLDDLDFRHWEAVGGLPDKVVGARNFNGSACAAPGSGGFDGHGHGTHVAGIAAGTGEGDPTTHDDDGRYLGIAPDARLAVGKVLTDAGAGLNSDLLAAFEWAAMPPDDPGASATCPPVGAHIVNTSLGSESRPQRLNTGHDIDMVSLMVDRLSVRYGTLFVSAAGNSGPYLGSVLEAPGGAAQALSVGATAKDWDLNHDATASGDTCSGYQRPDPGRTCQEDNVGTQGPSLGSFSSRGHIEGRFLKPDVVAPGYNLVSAQAKEGAALAQNDLNQNTRDDPLYATATGTSMASPATAGVAALLLDGYLDEHGVLPRGPSGVRGLRAPTTLLLRAALMNTAQPSLRESRWILTVSDANVDAVLDLCAGQGDPFTPIICDFVDILVGGFLGSLVLHDVRNDASDPWVGPLGEGAGKVRPELAVRALQDGVVIYRGADSATAAVQPKRQEYQASWQLGVVAPGVREGEPWVLRNAPAAPAVTASFRFLPGRASDGSLPIRTSGPSAWDIDLPGATPVGSGTSRTVHFALSAPPTTDPGTYSGVVQVDLRDGSGTLRQRLRVPVLATVAMHDRDGRAGRTAGAYSFLSDLDVFAKGDTVWPSLAGAAQGAAADWLVFPVDVALDRDEMRFTAWDAAAGDETYDLYLYDRYFDLVASTHPFVPGTTVTDPVANDARGPSTQASPQLLTFADPRPGRYWIVVNRARVGTVDAVGGDFGAFVLTLDEVAAP